MIAALLYLRECMKSSMTDESKDRVIARLVRYGKGGGLRRCVARILIFVVLAYYHSVGKRTEKI